MPQQIIMTAGGELRVIETGPVGPPGPPGPGSDGSFQNSPINASDIMYTDILLDVSQFTGVIAPERFTGPAPIATTTTMAVVNGGVDFDGLYVGGTLLENLANDELWEPVIRVGVIEARALLSGYLLTDFENLNPSGLHYTGRNSDGSWTPAVHLDNDQSGGVAASGAFLLDLRLDSGSVDHPVWGNVPPEDYVSVVPMPDPDEVGEPTSFTYLEVDFSVLPDNRDTLVVLLANQRWNIVPTAWPAHTRGPWAVCFQFESAHSSNQLMMGTTQAELDTWGFMPTTVPNLTIGYHSGRGDS